VRLSHQFLVSVILVSSGFGPPILG
jgi:hypothetical protein